MNESLPLPDRLFLNPGEVQIIKADLDISPQKLSQLRERLSSDEVDRARRYHFERDASRFVARRSLLRELLGKLLNVSPGQLRFSYGPYGKPALENPTGEQRLHFNLAHSQSTAVFAVTYGGEIGVDVERVRELPDLEGLVVTVLSEKERTEWQSLPSSHRLHVFFDFWTRKEALLKALGQGLQIPPREIEVSASCSKTGEGRRVWARGQEMAGWSVLSFAEGECSMAVAFGAGIPPGQVRCWKWPVR